MKYQKTPFYTVSQNMPDPVSIILFQATKWGIFLENLRRVLDLMEGKILASNPITTLLLHMHFFLSLV